jgi:hypothetical protein
MTTMADTTTTTVTKVTRSSNGLVEALFDSIDRLNRKEIDAEHARALSHTARTIVSIARLEIEHRQFSQDLGADRAKLVSLSIDGK